MLKAHCTAPSLAIKARISSTFQAVVRSPSFIGRGYLPDFTPFKNVVRLTGISAGIGGAALGLPTICQILKNPVSGRVVWFVLLWVCVATLHLICAYCRWLYLWLSQITGI